ncbi:HEAT repeat domain-containing protein [Mastigocladopsis repens]|uniref:HEAT repeat domain-containing protein n=1 Tax=Mastigocladopsis repens TaxID=221287 RepID=UPI000370351F|nr:HEAT repeat domain-containing protein [Mastigocladopsis repens]
MIRLLQPNQPEQTRRQAAGVLGEIGAGNPNAINALTELLHSALDEKTRWQAALSLGKVDPGNPLAGIRKVGVAESKYESCDCAERSALKGNRFKVAGA